ncbi:hypothetical protein [Thauera aromatica]|uniref:Uncharacterized protein n=1 Tax=Thauera aromatica K172 TaxID=44139 RepID=A0A2R4BIL1_THAAR|nr:hypothetical protein [Thauera aromatica]AVR87156.1 hypothetical protein Tharo_0205 [Thauera aromatica K172]
MPGIFREQALLDELPQWIELCQWISERRSALAQAPALALLDRKPQHEHDHPLLRHGVSRHGVVAALWNCHHGALIYPPGERSQVATHRYFHLQVQTLASYMQARFTYDQTRAGAGYSGLEHYEHYDGQREWPIAPSPTSDVGLAIRELSLAEHDQVVSLLPETQKAQDYAQAMAAIDLSSWESVDGKPDRIGRYLSSLKRYFARYANLLTQGVVFRLYRRARSERYNTGGRQRRPGYVNLPDVAGVFLQDQPAPDFDEDIDNCGGFEVTTVFIDVGLEENEETRTLEAAGLSPAETLEPTFQLYASTEIGTKLAQLRRQQLAIEMHAQALPFIYATPTPIELRTLHAFLLRRVERHLAGDAKNRTQARLECIGALILLSMLALGQPLKRVRELRFTVVDPSEPVTLRTDHTTLILNAGAGLGAALGAPAALTRGFWVPAIGPSYKTDLPDALSKMQRPPLAPGFLLPDTLGIGVLLTHFLGTENRTNKRVFGIEPSTAKQAVTQLLGAPGLERLTPLRLARALPTLLRSLGADATATWLLCAEADRGDEPRMFYTQHRVDALIRLYGRASHRLARQLGIAPATALPRLPAEPITSDEAIMVGARFVAPIGVVRDLLRTLTAEIRTSRRTPLFGALLVAYHASYTLYTWLFQALSTSIRALTSPRANTLFLTSPDDAVRAFDAALSDKDDERSSRARLAIVDKSLCLQLQNYRAHVDNLLQRLQPQIDRKQATDWQPFVVLDERRRLAPLTPTWVADQLAAHGAPLPANFHRAFLRTQLLTRGVTGEVIDSFLGHFNEGESPFGRFSSFDYGLHRTQLIPALQSLHEALELVPLKSRLLHHQDRRG